jgi:predicted amidophosphoribosyltransferase
MPRVLDHRVCPHCKAELGQPPPRVCPACGGSLQQRYLTAGCLTTKPLILCIGLSLVWLLAG